tara:strand:- start:4410 stop:4799 length:390 start_codon:yes stop_codon:yes gene_type:complete
MGILAKLMGKETGLVPRACDKQPVSLYRGVQIVAGSEACCRAAKILAGQRFLTDEIPKLPLEQCDVANCYCTYKLFDDRRTDERRLSDYSYDIIGELRDNDQRQGSNGDRRREPDDESAVRTWIASAFR